METHNPQLLPAVRKTKRQKQLLNVVYALEELQGALFRLTSAQSFCAKAELPDMSGHLRKMSHDVNMMKIHLQNIYKNNKILYTDVKKAYDSLEIVIGENNE